MIYGISHKMCTTFPSVTFVGLKWQIVHSHMNFHSCVITKIFLCIVVYVYIFPIQVYLMRFVVVQEDQAE